MGFFNNRFQNDVLHGLGKKGLNNSLFFEYFFGVVFKLLLHLRIYLNLRLYLKILNPFSNSRHFLQTKSHFVLLIKTKQNLIFLLRGYLGRFSGVRGFLPFVKSLIESVVSSIFFVFQDFLPEFSQKRPFQSEAFLLPVIYYLLLLLLVEENWLVAKKESVILLFQGFDYLLKLNHKILFQDFLGRFF